MSIVSGSCFLRSFQGGELLIIANHLKRRILLLGLVNYLKQINFKSFLECRYVRSNGKSDLTIGFFRRNRFSKTGESLR